MYCSILWSLTIDHQNALQCNIEPCPSCQYPPTIMIKALVLTFDRFITTKVCFPPGAKVSFGRMMKVPMTFFPPAIFCTRIFEPEAPEGSFCSKMTFCSDSWSWRYATSSSVAWAGGRESQNRVVVLCRSPPWVYSRCQRCYRRTLDLECGGKGRRHMCGSSGPLPKPFSTQTSRCPLTMLPVPRMNCDSCALNNEPAHCESPIILCDLVVVYA